jgi:hypothetical protein
VKIKLTDAVRARDAVQWLIANIGPRQPGTVGTVIRGTGWKCWFHLNDRFGDDMEFYIELDQHVDTEDAMMFALKWA